ncbi:energy transducer TonB [Flavobacterium sp. 3HN19-14]|uniref:energy transducer TonB n=1 Tax=Flavobacterium sp. 3HN19-14 TaxID=3448133 RepID=UPI003EE01E45
MQKNFRTPDEEVKGKVIVQFVVEKDGSLTDIKVVRDLGYGTGAEAIRVLKSAPKWKPGIQNGRAVRVLFSLPISIQSGG